MKTFLHNVGFIFKRMAFCLLVVIAISNLTSCSGEGGSSGGASTSTSNNVNSGTTLADGTVVNLSTQSLSVSSGSTTTATLSISGGISGTKLAFITKTNQISLAQSVKNNKSISNQLLVSLRPSSLISRNISLSKSIIFVDATKASPGIYNAIISVNYVSNGKNQTNTIGNIKITVDKSNKLVPGNIAFTPSSTNINESSTTQLVLTLEGSSGVNKLPIIISSSNSSIIAVGTSICNLTTINNSCSVEIRSLTDNGTATITARANGYESATANVNITPTPPVAGSLSLPTTSTVSYESSTTIILSLNNSIKITNVPVTITSSNSSKVAVTNSSCTLSSISNTCQIGLVAQSHESGQVIVTASASGYTSTTSVVTISGFPAESSGVISLQPPVLNIPYSSSSSIVLSLDGSMWQSGKTINISSSNPNAVSVGISSCILSTESNSCIIPLTAHHNESGQVVITASGNGYQSSNATVVITDVPPATAGVLSIIPESINFSSNTIESLTLNLSGESSTYPFSLNVAITSESPGIATVNSGSQNCNFTGNGSCVVYISKGSISGTTHIVFTPSDTVNYNMESIAVNVIPVYGQATLVLTNSNIVIPGNTSATINITGAYNINNSLTFVFSFEPSGLISMNPASCTILTPNESNASCSVIIDALHYGTVTINAVNPNYSILTDNIIMPYPAPFLTWTNGSNLIDRSGTYGTKGIESTTASPGGRSNLISWTNKGNSNYLWMFGGIGRASLNVAGKMNDLWRYNITNNSWTWVSGSNFIESSGIYGTLGVAASNNVPGARTRSISWVDSSGNLWMFGGSGKDSSNTSGQLSDLWKYSLGTNQWTWVGGSDLVNQNGIYTTLGIASSTNIPGARDGSAAWVDSNGNFWLFGGSAFDSDGGFGYINDLWKYNPTSNEWTWVSGSKFVESNGIYGNMGVASTTNVPGARNYVASWIDSNDDLWIFGGIGKDANGNSGLLNDLWKFSTNTKEWTFVGGSDITDQPGIYGTQYVGNNTNWPGSRRFASSWTDIHGNFWLFGGSELGDLWRYNPTTRQWTWLLGSSFTFEPTIYGTKGLAAIDNAIGSRDNPTNISWVDSDGNLWLFGGFVINDANIGYGNDLWKIQISN